jgi:hypothetical protein
MEANFTNSSYKRQLKQPKLRTPSQTISIINQAATTLLIRVLEVQGIFGRQTQILLATRNIQGSPRL